MAKRDTMVSSKELVGTSHDDSDTVEDEESEGGAGGGQGFTAPLVGDIAHLSVAVEDGVGSYCGTIRREEGGVDAESYTVWSAPLYASLREDNPAAQRGVAQ
jgi:hypothetical protein